MGDDSTFASLAPLGYEQLTAAQLAASIGFQSIPANAQFALITVNTAPVRFKDSGTAPDATHGLRLVNNQAPFFYQGDLNAARFILESGAPVVDVLYYRT